MYKQSIISKCLDVEDGEVLPAEADDPLFVPSVEDLGYGDATLADVSGEVFHFDEEFDLAFCVRKEAGEEVPQTFFGIVEQMG